MCLFCLYNLPSKCHQMPPFRALLAYYQSLLGNQVAILGSPPLGNHLPIKFGKPCDWYWMRRMLNGNFIKGLLIKLRSWLFVNASGASGPFYNRDRARFGCILGEIGAFGPRRPWLAKPPRPPSSLMPLSHRECIQSVHYPLNIT